MPEITTCIYGKWSDTCIKHRQNFHYTSVAKAIKVLRKLGCCLQIEVGIV